MGIVVQPLHPVYLNKNARVPLHHPAAVGDCHQLAWLQLAEMVLSPLPEQLGVLGHIKFHQSPAVGLVDLQALHPDPGVVYADDAGVEGEARLPLRGGAATGEESSPGQGGAVQQQKQNGKPAGAVSALGAHGASSWEKEP